MLHLVFIRRSAADLLASCLAALTPGDAVLMLDDEALELAANPIFADEFERLTAQGHRIMVLRPQTKKSRDGVPPGLEFINNEEFVGLVSEYKCSRSWFQE